MPITSDQIIAWIERYSNRIAEEKELLTKLDSEIGDADHGNNMHRGFQAVLAKKAELQGKDIGASKIVAMTLSRLSEELRVHCMEPSFYKLAA